MNDIFSINKNNSSYLLLLIQKDNIDVTPITAEYIDSNDDFYVDINGNNYVASG